MARLVLNRYVLTLATIAVIVVAWNVVVALDNDGIVEGVVVDATGAPVPAAEVMLHSNELDARTARPLETTTRADGAFRFEGSPYFHFRITAEKGDLKTEAPLTYHLYWRSQNFRLPEPVVIGGSAGG